MTGTNASQRRQLRSVSLLIAAATLSACSLLQDPFHRKQAAVVAPPPVPVIPAPLATHRFEILPDDDVIGTVQVTVASAEDTLSDIARRFNIGYEEIVRANPKVDPWLPGEGREIVIPTQYVLPNAPREGVVINLAAMRLFYFSKVKAGEPQVVYTHPLGIGKVGWATPLGATRVVRKAKDPTWRPGPGVRAEHKKNGEILPAVVPPGPDNPLGTRAMYLGWPQYLIHGTNKPYGVGLRSSHGCIRMYPEDVEMIYEKIPVGEKVRVVNQPFVFGWHDGQLYLQAYDVLEDDTRDWQKAQKRLLSKSLADRIQKELKSRAEAINWDSVSKVAHDPHGIPVSVSRADASVELIVASALRVQNRVPDGASWDGTSNLPVDEKTFQEMVSDSDPNAPAGSVSRARTGS